MLRTIALLKWKSFKAQLQYPANFCLSILGVSCIGAMDITLIAVPVHAFGSIGGWGMWELLFMFSLWKMSHALHHLCFVAFWQHDSLVRDGHYDRLLIRPVHPIWQILTADFTLSVFGELIPSLCMFALSSSHAHVSWNAYSVLFLIVVLCSGAVIEWAVSLFISGFSFFFVRTSSLRGIAHTFMFRVTQFPAHIYGRVFQFVLTFVFPYAFMNYYPTHYFFDLDVRIFYDFFPYAVPLVALAALTIAYGMWSFGLRHYHSTGS